MLSLAIFCTAWQVIAGRVDPILFTTPSKFVRALWTMITNGTLGPAFGTALKDLVVGHVIAAAMGISVGILIERSQVAERSLNLYINFFQATLLIALVPLVVIWFGVGFDARVVVVFILAVWSITWSTSSSRRASTPH